MGPTKELCANLSAMNINTQSKYIEGVPNRKTHALFFEYPVTSLLPMNTMPHLEPPANLGTRVAPPFDHRRAGIEHTDIMNLLRVDGRDLPEQVLIGDVSHLLEFVDTLRNDHGRSVLQMVCFCNDAQEKTFRMRLETTFANHPARTTEFEVTSRGWRTLLNLSVTKPWVNTLVQLITRGIDCTYYHVRHRLTAYYGAEAVAEEEQRWMHGWLSTDRRDVEIQEILAENEDKIDKLMDGMGLQ